MFPRHRSNAQLRISFSSYQCLPGLESVCRFEALLLEGSYCLGCRHNRHEFIQLMLYFAVKMVFMHVGEYDKIEWW